MGQDPSKDSDKRSSETKSDKKNHHEKQDNDNHSEKKKSRKGRRKRKGKGETDSSYSTSKEYESFVSKLDTSRLDHDVTEDIAKYYEIKNQVLGVGNFSTVKLGVQKSSGERCAIKIVDKTLVKNKPEMLKNEVGILLKVSHKNIIKMIDIFDSETTLFLVMELVTGGELFDRIVEREQYSEKDAAYVMKQLFSALTYLHGIGDGTGIVHRDLKPENLLLANDKDDIVKLADFGLSRIYTEEAMMSTACGTPGYVAPEILEAERGYDKAVDLWSAGVIMYILLCGYPPFYDENENVLFENIMAGKFQYHSPYWDKISDEATDLIDQLLVVDPAKRLSAEEALEHGWFRKWNKGNDRANSGEGKSIHHQFKNKMKKTNTFRKEKSKSGGNSRKEYIVVSK